MLLDFPKEMIYKDEQQELAEEEGMGERVLQGGTACMKA